MTHPLTGQRSRREQVAELYDSHASGLFVYCADQLGDLGSAADVLASVLTSAPEEPPRAALYAFARREIHRRDVVYAPPVVDPLIDPASALVERILRELRPQQREVLVLGHVCGLDLAELAWVLDVAPDTAEELALSAAHRFRQVLNQALAATGSPVPKPVADVYGALAVAPLRDVLGRLPWAEPPGPLRVLLAGSSAADPAPLFVKPRWPVPPAWPLPLGDGDPATTTGLFPRELLDPPPPSRVPDHDATTAPMPKLRGPLAEGPASFSSRLGPSPLAPRQTPSSLAPFDPSRPGSSSFDALRPGSSVSFDALRESPASTFGGTRQGSATPFEAFRPRSAQSGPTRPTPRGAKPGMGTAPNGFLTGDDLLDDAPPATGDLLDDPPPATSGLLVDPSPATGGPLVDPPPATGDFLVRQQSPAREASPLFTPRGRPAEPVYHMPLAPAEEAPPAPHPTGPEKDDSPNVFLGSRTDDSPATGPRTDESRSTGPRADESPRAGGSRPDIKVAGHKSPAARSRPGGGAKGDALATRPRPSVRKPPPKGRRPYPAKGRKKKRRNRHHDWAWELVGFLICVAIAMIVFFSVPMIITP